MATRKYGNMETQHLYERSMGGKAAKSPMAAKAPKMDEEEHEHKVDEDMNESEGDGNVEHLHKAHGEHARGAQKSAHIYAHEDGTHNLHTHDHETGAHEHTEHSSHEEALDAAKSHLAGSPVHEGLEDEAADSLEEAGHGHKLAGLEA